jgi:Fe-S oxidoreductase
VLHPYAARGIKIVGTEPSCLAVWKSDAAELVPEDPRVGEVAAAVMTLAEFLAHDPTFEVPDLSGHTIVAQPHCHEASVMGWDAEATLLAATGATVVKVQGCCGLAGNHGMIAGHYDFSKAVYATNLEPALDAAGEDAIVLADGFSCRTQLDDLRGLQALTFAELLAAHSA